VYGVLEQKNYFRQKGIKFKAIDITKDRKAAKDCEKNGCRGVPVILVGGSRWICGFDQAKIEKSLGI
jgi:glutaredoxin